MTGEGSSARSFVTSFLRMTRMTRYLQKSPTIPASCYIAPGAQVLHDVTLGENTSIWCNAVLRGDIASITVGRHSNIQDNATVHVDTDEPTTIGNYVSIGHNAIVHSASVGDYVLVGMGAVLLSGCKIGEGAMIAAGALVLENFEVPPKSLVVGVPGKVLRKLTPEEIAANRDNAERYSKLAQLYKSHK